jgi:DNA-binding FadR family transcriptional regulator
MNKSKYTRLPRSIEISDSYHATILKAIIDHDPEVARTAMRDHMRYIQDYIRRIEEAEAIK